MDNQTYNFDNHLSLFHEHILMFCLDPVSGTPVLFPHQLLSAKHKIRSNNMESVRSGKKNTVLSYRKLKIMQIEDI